MRAGAIHLTGLALLAQYLNEENCDTLLTTARGKSKRELEALIAAHFPKPDAPERLSPMPEQTSSPALTSSERTATVAEQKIRPGTANAGDQSTSGRLKPLSASRWSVQFTASAEFHAKIERARELVSHTNPSGDLAVLFERALDELIERETKRRLGVGKPRKQRALRLGSRHMPVDILRKVWERDDGRCTFVDEQGRRCTARRFLTVEHREPQALGGPTTVENCYLMCWSHNQHTARRVFGEAHIDAKRAEHAPGSTEANDQARTKNCAQAGICSQTQVRKRNHTEYDSRSR